MATLLVNQKMNPALGRRIEASVTGNRNPTVAHSSARWVSRIRLIIIAGLLTLALAIYLSLRREYAELQQARATLFAQWNAHAASLTPKDKDFLKRVEKALSQFYGPYPGDTIAEELRDPGAISALLARPAVYVRGPLSQFNSSAGIAKAAAESGKDTLLLCLIDPPTSHDEKAMLAKAHLALFGGSSSQPIAPNVLRLYDAELGLPVMLPPWGERIQYAKDQQSLRQLERELERAPLSLAKRVLRAEILIAVFDEPNNKGSITELDGEAGHDIRLAVKQLDPEKTLFWLRRTVNPRWITPHRRPQYARELDSCRFAIDVRQAVLDSFKPVEAASN